MYTFTQHAYAAIAYRGVQSPSLVTGHQLTHPHIYVSLTLPVMLRYSAVML